MKQERKMFSFYIFVDLLEKAKKEANEKRVPVSHVVNTAIKEFLENKDE